MKLKATKKEMKEGYYRIIGIGYCDAQFLLSNEKPFAYSCGLYGWKCDYYDIDGILISTGYDYIETKNARQDYNLIREYDKKAESLSQDERSLLLKEMVKKLTE